MKTEIWKDVVGYSGLYSVSDQGRVRSLERKVRHGQGTMKIVKERILKPSLNIKGYVKYTLNKNNKSETINSHKLVLEAFRCLKPKGLNASHKDGDQVNNELSNLKWETQSCNCNRKKDHGTQQEGISHGMSKLTEGEVTLIRYKYSSGINSMKDLSKAFNVSISTISSLVNRKTWKHI